MLSLCCFLGDCDTIWSGKSLQLLCILPFGMLCMSDISMMFGKICWQCVCWLVLWSGESGLSVFRELCPVVFLVVGESPSVLLIVVVMGKWVDDSAC